MVSSGMLAFYMHCLHVTSMGVQITIRDVPKTVRDELAARAAQEGKSMQEYLRQAMETLASKPSPEQWVAAVRERKSLSDTKVSAKDITQLREQDRR